MPAAVPAGAGRVDDGEARGAVIWIQQTITLAPRPRGVHLVTRELVGAIDGLDRIDVGILQLHLLHTSAALALQENASPDVGPDLAAWFDRAVPDGAPYFRHTLEGPDDMPAHVKSVLAGPTVSMPLRGGRPALGTWQGVHLLEFRDRGGARSVVATAWGRAAGAGDREDT